MLTATERTARLEPAELVDLPENPVPDGLSAGWFSGSGRKQVRYAICESRNEYCRGTIVLLQGRNETIEKYHETIRDLSERGYMVATFDWRGQGGSERLAKNPRRGHVGSMRAYVHDLDLFMQHVVLPDCRGPYAILAHSMGGLVALSAMPRLANRIERMVLAAPLVALPRGRAEMVVMRTLVGFLCLTGLGRLPVQAWPKQGAHSHLETNLLTSDRRRFKRNRRLIEAAPQLFVEAPSAAWVRAVVKAMRRIDKSDVIADMSVPTLIVTAGKDAVVRSLEAERLAWRMRSGSALTIPGARHEILQEADRYRDAFFAAFDSFMETALPIPTSYAVRSSFSSGHDRDELETAVAEAAERR